MASVLPMDELNKFADQIRERYGREPLPKSKQEEEDIIDELLDLFLLAYATGNEVTNANLSSDWMPKVDEVMSTVDEKIAGKTWRDRVDEYFSNGGTVDDIVRIAETETHRIANTSALHTAEHGGAKNKTWITMADERVRDTHQYLEMETVGIDEDFYTYDGDHARAPGLFSLPENNINCRCELIFS